MTKINRPWRMVAIAFSLAFILTLGGCVSFTSGVEPAHAKMDGLVNGFVAFPPVRPYDGTVLQFGLFKNQRQKGEIFFLELWPLGEVGIGILGARARIPYFELGLGALWHHPLPSTEDKHEAKQPVIIEPEPTPMPGTQSLAPPST